ncbi:MAG: translocation/assembly module TamB domain-containing protein [Polyangiales bacterium]
MAADPEPKPARRPRRRRLGVASLVLLGLVAAGLAVVQSRWFSRKVAAQVQKEVAAATGLDVAVGDVGFSFWDFAVHLDEVAVGRRGAAPLARVGRLLVAPSPGDLLRGRVQLSRVSVEGAEIDLRLVDRDGGLALANGPVVRSSGGGGGGDPPFRDIDVTDLRLRVSHPRLGELSVGPADVDVLQTPDRRFMVGLLASGGEVRSTQLTGPIRRLEARLSFDRRTEELRVALAHVAVARFEVHVREAAFSPRTNRLELDARAEAHVEDVLPFVPARHPDLFGAVAVDVRGRVDLATLDFQAAAGVSVRDLGMRAIDGKTHLPIVYNFGDEVRLRARATRDRVEVSDFAARWAGAEVSAPTLSLGLRGDYPLEADLQVRGLDFTRLMKNLTVTPHTIVLWTLSGALRLRATLDPMRFNFDLPGLEATDFAILTDGWDRPPQTPIIRIPRARLNGRMVIDPVSVTWSDVAASFAQTSLAARRIRVRTSADPTGREPEVQVDGVASDHIDLGDLGTILDIPISGVAQVRAQARGTGDPLVTGTMRVSDFRFATLPFGDLETAPGGGWRLQSLRLTSPRLVGRFRQSAYDVASAYLDFSRWTLTAGARVRSERFQAQDFYKMFHFDGDPVFAPYDGSARVDAQVDYVLGRPGDDRDGVMTVRAALDRGALVAFGEHIDDASARLSYDWLRRRDGVRGARVDLESFHGTKGGAPIDVSGAMAPGARMHFVATARAVPLLSLDTLRASSAPVSGTATVSVSVDGTPDAPRVFSTVSLRDLSALGRALGAVDLTVSQVPEGTPSRAPDARPVDGRITLDTRLLDDKLHVHTSLRVPWVEGRWRDALGVEHRDFSRDWGRSELSASVRTAGPIDVLPWLPPTVLARVGEGARARAGFAVTVDRARLDDLLHADGRLVVDHLDVGAAGMGASLGEHAALAACARGGVFWLDEAGARATCAEPPARLRGVPSLAAPGGPGFDLERPMILGPGGVRVWLAGGGVVGQRAEDPIRLSGKVRAELDLARAAALVPAITWGRGRGVLDLDVAWDGERPDLSGSAHMADASVGLAALPAPLSNIDLDVALRGDVVDVTTARMNYGPATIEASGARLHLERTSLERVQVPVRVRNLLLSSRDGLPEGLEAGVDADLSFSRVSADEPALLSGEVTVTRGRFTRPIPLTGDFLRRLGGSDGASAGAQEAAAEQPYDPANDWLRLDVRVNMPTPFRVANNLAEADVRLGTGRPFVITGTNQRYGVLGTVEVPRGVVHLNETDFEIRRARVDFDNPERVAPAFDLLAQTDIRRTTDTTVRSQWRVNLHAYGTPERVNLEFSAEPSLALEDIVLLLLFRLTRAEMERVGGGNAGQAVTIELLSRSLGLDRVVQGALPFIDEFRPGSTYNYRSGVIEPSLSLGGRITDTLRWSGMTTFAAQPLIQGTLNLRVGRSVAVQVFLNNATNQPSTQVPNAGVDVRWRLIQ